MDGKWALITGATGGLGTEFAKIHAARSGNLFLVARDSEKLDAMKQSMEAAYAVKAVTFAVDLSDEDAADRVYAFAKQENIQVDYLINNAGFGGHGAFHERTMEQDMSMLSVNVVAVTKLLKLFLPDFVNRGEGKILNVSSTAALTPGPLQAEYYATKAYVTSLSNAIWREVRGTGVTVTALMPGAMDTGFIRASDMGDTALFAHPVSPVNVAKAGYEGMLAGKLNVFASLPGWQAPFRSLMPMFPKKLMMNMIYKMQQKSADRGSSEEVSRRTLRPLRISTG